MQQTYKAPDNTLHVICPEYEYLLPAGCVPITDEEAEAIRQANAPPLQIPQSVTMRQARLALLGAGLLSSVDAAIESLPEPQRSAALIEWEYSGEVHRNRAFVIQLGGALGLTDEQLDDLFIAAAAL